MYFLMASAPSFDIVFGILSMILVGSSWMLFGIIMGKAPRENLDVSSILFISGLIGLGTSLCFAFSQPAPACSSQVFRLTFLSLFINGVFNYLQLEVMSRAMQKGPNGIIWAIAQAGFIVPSLMGILCFHEILSLQKFLGFLCMIAMLLLFAFGSNAQYGERKSYGRWKLLALITFLFTGLSQAFSILPSYYSEATAISSQWRTAFFSIGLCTTAVVISVFNNRMEFLTTFARNCFKAKTWFYCILLQGIELIGYFFFYYPGMDCLARANLGAVSFPLMVGSCIAAFEIYCLGFLREKRNRLQLAGLILCLLGILAICL